MKKKGMAVVLALLVMSVFLMTGCAKTALADCFDKDTIIETAEQIIREVHVDNGIEDVLNTYMREDYLEEYPMESMQEQVLELLVANGEFLAFSQETVIGTESNDGEEDWAVISITATYEKDEILFTLTFDEDMKLVGFYAK